MSLETPVLFIIFNRPDLERQVFERIREVKPKKLFVNAEVTHLDGFNVLKMSLLIVAIADFNVLM